jgi:hypothetical protein
LANFGDKYTAEVEIQARGTERVDRARDALGRFTKATADAAATAKAAAPAATMMASGLEQVELAAMDTAAAVRAADYHLEMMIHTQRQATVAMNLSRDAGSRLGMGILMVSQAAEDAQFGVRGLMNNIMPLVTTIGGFSPVAVGIGAALQLVVGANRELIDGWLAAAGILDENLIPKTKEATAALEEFEAVSKRQTTAQQESGRRAQEAIAEFGGATDTATGAENLSAAVQGLMLQGIEDDPAVKAARRELATRTRATDRATDPDAMVAAKSMEDAARKGLEAALAGFRTRAEQRAQGMIGGAATGNEAELVSLLRTLNENAQFFAGRGIAPELAGGLAGARQGRVLSDRRDEEFAKRMEEEEQRIQEEIRNDEEAAQIEARAQADAEREAEAARRERERAQEQADREAQRRAGELGGAAGLHGEMMDGGSPAALAEQMYEDLRNQGMGVAQAFEMAGRAVTQAQQEVAQAQQENDLAALNLFRQQAEHNREMREQMDWLASELARARGLTGGWARQQQARAMNGLGAFP